MRLLEELRDPLSAGYLDEGDCGFLMAKAANELDMLEYVLEHAMGMISHAAHGNNSDQCPHCREAKAFLSRIRPITSKK